MLSALLLAASTTMLSLDGGRLHLEVPSRVHVRQANVNWETEAYDLYEGDDKQPFVVIIDGGGAYHRHTFAKFCLNGRQAWKTESADSGTVVVGNPGFTAVSASWARLSGDRLTEAKAIVSSIRIDWGEKC